MTGHVDRLPVTVEAAHAGSNEDATPHARQTPYHVHNARAGKINKASSEEMIKLVAAVTEPSCNRNRSQKSEAEINCIKFTKNSKLPPCTPDLITFV